MSEAVTPAADPAAAAPVVPVEAPPVEQIDKAPVEKSTFTDAELRAYKAKGNTPSKPTDPAPVEPKPAEAKTDEVPPKVDTPVPPKHQPKPDAEKRIQQLTRELNEAKQKLAAQPKPADPAAAKPEAPVVNADPMPQMAKYAADDTEKFFTDFAEWNVREATRRAEAMFADRDTKAEKSKAETAAKEQQVVLDAARKAIETEFPDWAEVVIGTDEADGIATKLSPAMLGWCDSDPEVSFRGLYELAKLPEAEQEAFFKLNNGRKVAKLVQFGEKPIAPVPPVVPGAGKKPGPVTKMVTGPLTPAEDPIKAIINGGEINDAAVRAFKANRNAAEAAARKR